MSSSYLVLSLKLVSESGKVSERRLVDTNYISYEHDEDGKPWKAIIKNSYGDVKFELYYDMLIGDGFYREENAKRRLIRNFVRIRIDPDHPKNVRRAALAVIAFQEPLDVWKWVLPARRELNRMIRRARRERRAAGLPEVRPLKPYAFDNQNPYAKDPRRPRGYDRKTWMDHVPPDSESPEEDNTTEEVRVASVTPTPADSDWAAPPEPSARIGTPKLTDDVDESPWGEMADWPTYYKKPESPPFDDVLDYSLDLLVAEVEEESKRDQEEMERERDKLVNRFKNVEPEKELEMELELALLNGQDYKPERETILREPAPVKHEKPMEEIDDIPEEMEEKEQEWEIIHDEPMETGTPEAPKSPEPEIEQVAADDVNFGNLIGEVQPAGYFSDEEDLEQWLNQEDEQKLDEDQEEEKEEEKEQERELEEDQEKEEEEQEQEINDREKEEEEEEPKDRRYSLKRKYEVEEEKDEEEKKEEANQEVKENGKVAGRNIVLDNRRIIELKAPMPPCRTRARGAIPNSIKVSKRQLIRQRTPIVAATAATRLLTRRVEVPKCTRDNAHRCLNNESSTNCYINATLQALSSCFPAVIRIRYLCNQYMGVTNRFDRLTKSERRLMFMCFDIVYWLSLRSTDWKANDWFEPKHQRSEEAPLDPINKEFLESFKQTFCRKHNFALDEQQDAFEFFMFLLTDFEDSIAKVDASPLTNGNTAKSIPLFRMNPKEPFKMDIEEVRICKNCRTRTLSTRMETELRVNVEPYRNVFDLLLKKQKRWTDIKRRCERCKCPEAIESERVARFPQVLLVHVNRLEQDDKRDEEVYPNMEITADELGTFKERPSAYGPNIASLKEVSPNDSSVVSLERSDSEHWFQPNLDPETHVQMLKSMGIYRQRVGIDGYTAHTKEYPKKPVALGKFAPPGKTRSVSGDGNCYFRALSWILTGQEKSHSLIRKHVMNEVYEHKEHYKRYTEENITEHITKMLRDGEWATHVEIIATAALFNVDVYTYLEGVWIRHAPRTRKEQQQQQQQTDRDPKAVGAIYLNNPNNNHYDPVLTIEGFGDAGGHGPAVHVAKNKYKLCAVICHEGDKQSGHYFTYSKDLYDDKWSYCSDQTIEKIETSRLKRSWRNTCYMLFYNLQPPPIEPF
ncbi:unnamed protein product [Caenorhabditis sp. 36 PRJEB53466]|nr:unnamed protein product [Caenorhabditis sp. 36 PRJEB53466]